jgi:hypothetical protein
MFAGEAGAVMMIEIRGASNAKAKRELGWQPSHPSWRGVREVSSPEPLLEAGLDSPGLPRWTNGAKGMCMDRYAVAHVDEIGELDDGRAPMRAVRHHLRHHVFRCQGLDGP